MKQLAQRLAAFMIDWVVLFTVFVAPQFVLAVALGDWVLDYDSPPLLSWAWVAVTVSVPSWIYFTVADSSRSGATIGKRLLGFSVRDVTGGRISRGRALLRTTVKLLPWEMTHVMIFFPEPFGDELTTGKIILMVTANILLFVWLVAPILDRPYFRALHDRVAGSVVIHARSDSARNKSL